MYSVFSPLQNFPKPRSLKNKKIFVFSGIGDPASFILSLKNLGATICGIKKFVDHHKYKQKDLLVINQKGMDEVASELAREWGGSPGVHYIPEFYDYPGLASWMEKEHGIHQVSEGIHDDFQITSMMFSIDRDSVRYDQRVVKNLDSINGVSLTPVANTYALGKAAIEWRTEKTVEAINRSIGR